MKEDMVIIINDYFKEFLKDKINCPGLKKRIFYLKGNTLEAEEFLDTYSSGLILHYLLNADGSPLTDRWVPYRELPGGLFYWQTIPGVLEPLVKKYESNGSGFLEKALEIGGEKY